MMRRFSRHPMHRNPSDSPGGRFYANESYGSSDMPDEMFSPTPWAVIPDNIGSRTDYTIEFAQDEEPIAKVYGRHPEARANARLMASAPGLLDALYQIARIQNTEMYDEQARDYMANIAREAIARVMPPK